MEVLGRLTGLRQALYTVRVSGQISTHSLTQLNAQLSKVRVFAPVALAVQVNSSGGAIAQANLIRQRLLAFSKVHNCPVLTFAEDYAAGGGYIVLTAGNEVWAHPNSLVGSLAAVGVSLRLKEAAGRYGVERKVWATSPNDLEARFDLFKELTPETKKWLKGVMDTSQEDIKTLVESVRKGKLQVEEAKRDEVLFNGDVFNGTKAASLG